jgi:hypothetical protein
MSTMTFSPALSPALSPARPVARTVARTGQPRPLRLTRRGRILVVLAFLALAAILMTVFGGLATATREAGTPEPVRIVEVGPGDTLYALAGTVAEPGHIRDMVAHIEQLNSLTGPQLTVGQRIAVPTGAAK